jgi:hypothetical protein
MQHGMCEDNNLVLSSEKVMAIFICHKYIILNSYFLKIAMPPNKDGKHDNVDQLLIQ